MGVFVSTPFLELSILRATVESSTSMKSYSIVLENQFLYLKKEKKKGEKRGKETNRERRGLIDIMYSELCALKVPEPPVVGT